MSKTAIKQVTTKQNNIKIVLVSTMIGLSAGIVSVLYRLAISSAESISLTMYSYIETHLQFVPILFIGLAIAGYLMGCVITKYPLTSGSGIPQVKGQILGYIKSNWFTTLIVKFFAGMTAIIAGLSLGREGPSIQLGASVAQGVSEKIGASNTEKRIFITSGASAGLAAAFNAPLAGVMFALEEIFRYFSPVVLLSTLVAAIVADFVSKVYFGISPVFDFEVTASLPISYYWLFILLGIFLGFSGVFYNLCIVKSQKLYKYISAINPKYKPILPFMIAGILGITLPIVLGGGHSIIHELSIENSMMYLLMILVIKFIFSMISFGSGTPGGIFFPLLVLGATLGAIFAKIAIPGLGLDAVLFYNFVIIAMAGYFAAIVRAPLTGIILLVEMTGSFSQLLPLIITSTVAYLVAEELNNKPIYDSLLENLLENHHIHQEPANRSKIVIERVVHIGANVENKYLREIQLPARCLIVAISRGENDITPNGDTFIKSGDILTFLVDTSNEIVVRQAIEQLLGD